MSWVELSWAEWSWAEWSRADWSWDEWSWGEMGGLHIQANFVVINNQPKSWVELSWKELGIYLSSNSQLTSAHVNWAGRSLVYYVPQNLTCWNHLEHKNINNCLCCYCFGKNASNSWDARARQRCAVYAMQLRMPQKKPASKNWRLTGFARENAEMEFVSETSFLLQKKYITLHSYYISFLFP